MGDENRNVIKLEELGVDKVKKHLEKYRGRIPNVILEELYEKLKDKDVSEEQIDRIVQRVEENLFTFNKVGNILRKLDSIENLVRQVVKQEVPVSEVPAESQVESVTVETPFDKPARLNAIANDARIIMILLRWIEFLIERVGYDGLEDVLDYYVDVGWISEDVMFTVLKYAKGIKLYHENSDWRPVGFMSVKDHITSLMFIEALRTGKFDRDALLSVEREIHKIKKEIAELHGV